MLLIVQARSDREFSEIRATYSKLKLALEIERNRAICKGIMNKIIYLKLSEIKATIASLYTTECVTQSSRTLTPTIASKKKYYLCPYLRYVFLKFWSGL